MVSGIRHSVSSCFSLTESTALQHEINGLENLEYHMAREVESLREQYDASHQSLMVQCVSYSLAMYCVLRVASVSTAVAVASDGILSRADSSLQSIRNMISVQDPNNQQQGPSSPDIAAQLVSLVLSNLGFSVDKNVLARQLSLLFIGLLIAVNIRVVLRECLRVSGLGYEIYDGTSFDDHAFSS